MHLEQAKKTPDRDIKKHLTPLNIGIGLSVLSFFIIWVSTCSLLATNDKLPAPRVINKTQSPTAVLTDRYKVSFYKSQLKDDCKALNIRPVSMRALAAVNPLRKELPVPKTLSLLRKKHGTLQTESLTIKLKTKRLLIGADGSGITALHYVLSITNRTDSFLAYRVDTKYLFGKADFAHLAHNAIALRPRETITRSEGLVRKNGKIIVNRVEVLELTRLGYHYVSRLDPIQLGYPKRSTTGHSFGKFGRCQIIPWRMIQKAMKIKTIHWYDVIDFYSRHNCSEYSYFKGYYLAKDDVETLPAQGPNARKPAE